MLSIGIAATSFSSMIGNTHAFEAVEKAAPKQTKVMRKDSLDHWDSDTLAYYLDNYPGYDLAVMFYATWDNNSHRLAPLWNQIAVLLDAGTTQSKLIMVRIFSPASARAFNFNLRTTFSVHRLQKFKILTVVSRVPTIFGFLWSFPPYIAVADNFIELPLQCTNQYNLVNKRLYLIAS